jgi:long-chain acyl-CoA synthetase
VEKTLHLTDYLHRNAAEHGSKPAIIFESRQTSWSDLWEEVRTKSAYFTAELGNKEQKLVDLLLTNSTEFAATYLAVLHAGHIALPLDPAYKKLELDAIIAQVPPAMIITSQRYKDQISRHHAKTVMAEQLKSFKPAGSRPLRLDPAKQITSLTFTSGTSGKPKVVPHTHANDTWNIGACSAVWSWTGQDTMLLNLPLSHWYGLVMGLSGAVYHGNTVYLHQQSFDAQAVLEELASGRISFFTHVPLAYEQMLDAGQNKTYDISKVRLCVSGGAALPITTAKAFKKRFGIELVETYGSSETGRIVANRPGRTVPGSPGKPLAGVDLRLSDEGEVLVKSPGVFPGYFRNQAATNQSRTGDGYWRTGDLAEIRDGNIFLKGRIKERIRRFSYTVSPRDVEWAMRQNPAIKDIYVLGRQVAGQPNDELVYFIVGSITDKEIAVFAKENLLFAWRPDRIIRLDELPRTRMGKTKIADLARLAETKG